MRVARGTDSSASIAGFGVVFVLALIGLVRGQISSDPLHPKLQPTTLFVHSIQSCCPIVEDQDGIKGDYAKLLMKCANESSLKNNDVVINRLYTSGGPSLGVGIVTYATSDIHNYFSAALAVNEAYAEHNGYVFKHFDEKTANYDGDDVRWNKVKILAEALDPDRGWARDLDYVVWIDADIIILDMGLRLELVAADNADADFLVSAEHAGSTTLINSGTVMVKNSAWSRRFLQDWWDFADRRLYSDQEQFDMLYKAQVLSGKTSNRVAILPPDALNSDPPAMTQQKPNNQVVSAVC
jgi:hypothetical protein